MLDGAFKWLFPQSKTAVPAPVSDDSAVADLVGRISRLENSVTDLQLTWAEVLDKLQRWTNRQSARDAARVKANLGAMAETHENDVGDANGEGAGDIVNPNSRAAMKARLRAKISQGGAR